MFSNISKIATSSLAILTITSINSLNLIIHTSHIPVNAQESKQQSLEAITAYSDGLKLLNDRKFPEAIVKLNLALKLYKTLGNKSYQGRSYLGLCQANSQLDLVVALPFCEKSLIIARELKDNVQIRLSLKSSLKFLFDYGKAETEKNRSASALKSFISAKLIAEELGDKKIVGFILIYIGTTYTALADYPMAIRAFDESISIHQKLDDAEKTTKILSILLLQGDVYEYSAQYNKAIYNYQTALKTSREIKDQTVEVSALLRLAAAYNSVGQYQESEKIGMEGLAIAKKIDNKNFEAVILNGLGSTSVYLKKYLPAQAYLEQSLMIYREQGDVSQTQLVLVNLGKVAYELKQYDKSLDYYQQASKEQSDKRLAASIFNNIGDVYFKQGKSQAALENYQQAATLAHNISVANIEGVALTNQGTVLYSQGKLPDAEIQLRAAIKIWETLRTGLNDKNKVSFAEAISGTYDLLQKVLIEQGKFQAALEISERARARALAELLASKVVGTSSIKANKIRQAPNLIQIQKIAKNQQATLVQYSVIGDTIYTWVIKPTGEISFHQVTLPPKTSLKDLVVATRDSIKASRGRKSKDDSPKTTGGDLKQLHKLLIAPIAQELPKNPEERVIILPQNELFLVPFAALQNPQGEYLIQQHTLTIAPSIQVLALTERKNNKSKFPPLVVGNPIMPLYKGEPLPNLEGAEAEARSVSQILQVEPLIGAKADKQKVVELMQRAPLIHLATHGLLDTIKGDIPGAIALTNGFLTSGEIFDMNLSADLVVLSACNTGRGGADVTGEGVVGLSRSLSVAGVPSVLVSLWEVDDDATKALMEEFYHNLQEKKLSKAQSLRQAMLTTMKKYPDPNLWAAFMLVGEGR